MQLRQHRQGNGQGQGHSIGRRSRDSKLPAIPEYAVQYPDENSKNNIENSKKEGNYYEDLVKNNKSDNKAYTEMNYSLEDKGENELNNATDENDESKDTPDNDEINGTTQEENVEYANIGYVNEVINEAEIEHEHSHSSPGKDNELNIASDNISNSSGKLTRDDGFQKSSETCSHEDYSNKINQEDTGLYGNMYAYVIS